ncbi:MAG: hypothetical protein GXP63_02615 [DPANN group archaeon]|nr:hypothetical protein [DPANN group archaeon]
MLSKEGHAGNRATAASLWKRKDADGDTDLFIMALQTVLVVMVVVVLYGNMASVSDSTYFNKIYYVRDIGLLTSAVYAAPGNLELYYPPPLDRYTLNFSNDTVSIRDDKSILPFRYPYGQDTAYSLHDKGVLTSLAMAKQENTLLVFDKDDPKVSLRLMDCGSRSSTPLAQIKVIIDPGFATSSERALTWSITRALLGTGTGYPASATRSRQSRPTDKERYQKMQGNLVMLSLHQGANADPAVEDVVAYVPQPRDSRFRPSKHLACRILNEIQAAFPQLQGTAVLPGNQPELYAGNPLAVYLEIGNSRADPQLSITSSPGPLAHAIDTAILDYFPKKVGP